MYAMTLRLPINDRRALRNKLKPSINNPIPIIMFCFLFNRFKKMYETNNSTPFRMSGFLYRSRKTRYVVILVAILCGAFIGGLVHGTVYNAMVGERRIELAPYGVAVMMNIFFVEITGAIAYVLLQKFTGYV